MNAAETLDAAKAIVTGARNATHGRPERSFETIAGFWREYLDARISAELSRRGGDERFEDNGLSGLGVLTPADVARMMELLKVARAAHGADPDHDVDSCGYAAIASELSGAKNA